MADNLSNTSAENTSIFSPFSTDSTLFSPSKLMVTIQLLNDEANIQTEFKKNDTGQEILDYVCAYLDIVEKDYFGLLYQDSNNKIKYWVDPTKPLAKRFSSKSSLTLRFRVRFYPKDPVVLKEDITRYQIFSQLRRDLLDGHLICSEHVSAELAALILQSVLGDFNVFKYHIGYVSQYQLLCKQYDRLEDKIAEMHRNFKGLTSTEAEAKFLESASRLSTYGFDPYVVRDAKLNVEITIGITCRGIMIYLQNSQIHYLQWEDLSKVDYSGKQLRIYPEQSYLDRYQPGTEQMAIGELFLKSTLYVTRVKDSKKMSSNKNTKFKLTCPSSKFAKNLWKHILAVQVFFTEDQARLVKPKFSKPRFPLILRGSTFRCPTKRVLHEIEQDSTPPRDQQPANFTRFKIPRNALDAASSTVYKVTNKSATLPAMHIRSFSASTQQTLVASNDDQYSKLFDFGNLTEFVTTFDEILLQILVECQNSSSDLDFERIILKIVSLLDSAIEEVSKIIEGLEKYEDTINVALMVTRNVTCSV